MPRLEHGTVAGLGQEVGVSNTGQVRLLLGKLEPTGDLRLGKACVQICVFK